MPEAFEKCRSDGGKIYTASGPNKRFKLKAGEYRHYCSFGGNTFLGHKKKKRYGKK